jgi:hypothetical protein
MRCSGMRRGHWNLIHSRRVRVVFGRSRPADRLVMHARASVLLSLLVACVSQLACHSNPAGPGAQLATGRWAGDGACLSVADTECNLTVGCGHGQFPRPIVRSDGTFEVDGSYRIEIGPISIEPAPPAHYSGSVDGSRLLLTVVPSIPSLPRMSYSMTRASIGLCSIACL